MSKNNQAVWQLRHAQAGLALISAMLVVVVITSAAVTLAQHQRLEIRRAENILANSRSLALVRELETHAETLLQVDRSTSRHDALTEDWATEVITARHHEFAGQGVVVDRSGQFNLNNLMFDPARSAARGAAPGAAAATPGAGEQADAVEVATDTATADPATATNRIAGPGVLSANAQNPAGFDNTVLGNDAAAAAAPGLAASNTADAARIDQRNQPPAVNTAELIDALQQAFTIRCNNAGGAQTFDCEKRFTDRQRSLDPSALNAIMSANEPPVSAETAATTSTPAATNNVGSMSAPGVSTNVQPAFAAANPGLAAHNGNATQPGVPADAKPADGSVSADVAPARNTGGRFGGGVSPGAALKAQENRLRLLFMALDIDTGLVQAVMDWLDADSETRFPNGAEDDYYLDQEDPYRAANGALADVRELNLIRGMTPEVVEKLMPFVTVLPTPTPVNVNTAPAEVLMSLGPGIDRGVADSIIAMREAQPFQSVAQFRSLLSTMGRNLLDNQISVESRYFELNTRIEGPRMANVMNSLLLREEGKVDVLNRRRELLP